jgi:hypothetical protein
LRRRDENDDKDTESCQHYILNPPSEHSDCSWDRLLGLSVTEGYDYRGCVTCLLEGMVNNFETRGSP